MNSSNGGRTLERVTGVLVKWRADRHFGFAESPTTMGEDVFIHPSELVTPDDEGRLRVGARLTFELSESPKGWRGVRVALLS